MAKAVICRVFDKQRQGVKRAVLTRLDSPISDKKSLVFLAQSAQENNELSQINGSRSL